jgi:hypothetical protein
MFEGWRDRLEQLMADLTPGTDPRERTGPLREAMIELKMGLQAMREGLDATVGKLEEQRQHLADVERRGRLAADVPDPETVRIAEEFAEKHGERITMLERKLAVQQQEMTMAQRDLDQLRASYKAASMGLEDDGNLASVNQAWRELEAAGGQRPETDLKGELLQADLDRKAKQAAVEEQLAYLKRKMKDDR